MMGDFLKDLLEFVIPPVDSDTAKQYGWRVRMAILASGTFLGLVSVTAWAFGLVPHLDGFVRVSDAQAMQQQVAASIAVLQQQLVASESERIAGELLQLRVQHCKSKSEGERELLWGRISALLMRYQQLTKQPYQLPQCSDL